MQVLTDAGQGGYASPIDEAEIRTEAMAVGLVAADRLASLLLHNAEVGPRPGLKVQLSLNNIFHYSKVFASLVGKTMSRVFALTVDVLSAIISAAL